MARVSVSSSISMRREGSKLAWLLAQTGTLRDEGKEMWLLQVCMV